MYWRHYEFSLQPNIAVIGSEKCSLIFFFKQKKKQNMNLAEKVDKCLLDECMQNWGSGT